MSKPPPVTSDVPSVAMPAVRFVVSIGLPSLPTSSVATGLVPAKLVAATVKKIGPLLKSRPLKV
jgi:hypothetical protein